MREGGKCKKYIGVYEHAKYYHGTLYATAVTRSILNGNIFKNSVLAPIFNFSVQTGSIF